MAKKQFQTISVNDFSFGIDSNNTPDALKDGWCEDIVNGSLTAGGDIEKRHGWKTVAGSLPVRVSAASRAGNNITLTLDGVTDATGLTVGPIVVYGHLSSAAAGATGDLLVTTDQARAYTTFTKSGATITVAGTAGVWTSDSAPQLTVWGLNWAELVPATLGRVQGLFNYTSPTADELIAVCNGAVFKDAAGVNSTYLIGLTAGYEPAFGLTLTSTNKIGPALYLTGATPGRTRGYITSSGIALGQAPVASFLWDAGTTVKVKLSLPAWQAYSSADAPVAFTTQITTDDWLTISEGSVPGSWQVTAVDTTDPDYITLSVSIPEVTGPSQNTYSSGTAGVLSDRTAESTANAIATTDTLRILNSVGTVLASGLTPRLNAGGLLTATGFTSIVTLDGAGSWGELTRSTATFLAKAVTNLVPGDSLTSSSGLMRKVTGISGSTITLDQSLTLVGVPSTCLLRPTGWEEFQVTARWVPVEAPTSTQGLVKLTHTKYLSSSVKHVQASKVGESLYLTDGVNPVLKYDGSNVYRAGLLPWQPGLFASVDTRTPSIFPAFPPVAYTASSSNTFTCALDSTLGSFAEWDRVRDSIDGTVYTINEIQKNTTSDLIHVDKDITSTFAGTPTLTRLCIYRYYFRLNQVDANGRTTASAVANSEDFRVELSEPCQVQLKLLGLPAFNLLDHDRLELQGYRTKANTVAPYFLLQSLSCSFVNNSQELLFTDSWSDFELTESQWDPTNTLMAGAELGVGWEEPPRANCSTSTQSRTLTGNITTAPTMDLQVLPNSGTSALPSTIVSPKTALLIRKDPTDSSSSTNMIDRVVYEFVHNGPGREAAANTGLSVAISDDGDRLAIGSPYENNGGTDRGSVYIYKKTATSWVQETKITASDQANNNLFGSAVAIDSLGTRVCVGTKYWNGSGDDRGAAYVFTRSGTSWTEEQRVVTGSADFDYLGASVSIDSTGTRIAVGAPGVDGAGSDRGNVRIFLRTGATWAQEQVLTPAAPADSAGFGSSVYLDSTGTRVAIGAPSDAFTASGTTYAFVRAGVNWTEEQAFSASDAAVGDFFGAAVGIDSTGTRIVSGAWARNAAGSQRGAAYIHTRTGVAWAEEAILAASDTADNDFLGWDVSIDSSGTRVIASAYGEDGAGTDRGASYVFTRSGVNWAQEQKITSSDPVNSDEYGWSARLDSSGTYGIVGTPHKSYAGITNTGSFYLYSRSGTTWTEVVKLPEERRGIRINPATQWSPTETTSVTIAVITGIPVPIVGSWVYLYYMDTANDPSVTSYQVNSREDLQLDFCGWYQVASATSSTFTLNCPTSKSLITNSFVNSADFISAANDTIKLGDSADQFPVNSKVIFKTTAPPGLSNTVVYYVVYNSGGYIKLSTTRGGATLSDITGVDANTSILINYNFPTHWCTSTISKAVPVPLAEDYNYYSLRNSTITESNLALDGSPLLLQILSSRLTAAINATMTKVDTSISGYTTFTPWLIASGGASYTAGKCLVKSRDASTSPELVLGSGFSSLCRMFVNGSLGINSQEVPFQTTYFPSRAVRSFPNYPEIFDRPFATLQTSSESVIDVNSADGQEITALVNFFAESYSAGSAGSSREDLVLAFKNTSVYAINPESREVKKLDTKGLGCTAPSSVKATADGVFFANASGVYLIDKQLQVRYIGRSMAGKWHDNVNLAEIWDHAVGHASARERKYQIFLPVNGGVVASQAHVFDWSRMQDEGHPGGWCRWLNQPFTCGASQDETEFWGTTDGRVVVETDGWADDGVAVPMTVTHKAFDFGLPGSRKLVSHVVPRFRAVQDCSGVQMSVARDLSTTFTNFSSFDISAADGKKIAQERLSVPTEQRKCTFLQPKLEHSTLDEDCILTGLDFVVSLESSKGIKEPGRTPENE